MPTESLEPVSCRKVLPVIVIPLMCAFGPGKASTPEGPTMLWLAKLMSRLSKTLSTIWTFLICCRIGPGGSPPSGPVRANPCPAIT